MYTSQCTIASLMIKSRIDEEAIPTYDQIKSVSNYIQEKKLKKIKILVPSN